MEGCQYICWNSWLELDADQLSYSKDVLWNLTFFSLFYSWKWKMKIQLMFFNNRQAASSNLPHVTIFPPQRNQPTFLTCDAHRLFLCNLFHCLNGFPSRRSYRFSATRNCCIVFSFLPRHAFLILYINHIQIILSWGLVCSCCIV